MEDNAVLQGKGSYPTGLRGVVLLALAALSLAVLSESASAAQPVGKDGKVYACYKAKGKKKGSVRLVGKGARCKKGERKVSWGVTGPAGPQGATGATGPAGASGLESKLTEITTRVSALEATLEGVTNEALTKALATVSGITNGQLQETIASLADVNALCTQASTLTNQINSVGEALEGTVLGGVIPLGLELLVPGLPAELPAFTCP